MFETPSQKPLQNSQFWKYPKLPGLISPRLGGKTGKKMLDIITQPSLFLIFNIKIKRVVYSFKIYLLFKTVI